MCPPTRPSGIRENMGRSQEVQGVGCPPYCDLRVEMGSYGCQLHGDYIFAQTPNDNSSLIRFKPANLADLWHICILNELGFNSSLLYRRPPSVDKFGQCKQAKGKSLREA